MGNCGEIGADCGGDVRSDLVGKCIMRLLAGFTGYMTSPRHKEPNRMWVGRESFT
jgi:hypothetical protein